MRATATVDRTRTAEVDRTLRDLPEDLLAVVRYGTEHEPYSRFRRGSQVYGLEHGDHGEIRRTDCGPQSYVVLEVVGPLIFSFVSFED